MSHDVMHSWTKLSIISTASTYVSSYMVSLLSPEGFLTQCFRRLTCKKQEAKDVESGEKEDVEV